MKEKAILDSKYNDTFLAMAFQEGLLVADKRKTDEVYERYKTTAIDENLRKPLLDKLLLSPFPILDKPLLAGVEGELVEREILGFREKETETFVPMNDYPTELFLERLEQAGMPIDEPGLRQLIAEILSTNAELDALEKEFNGKLPNLNWHRFSQAIAEGLGLPKADFDFDDLSVKKLESAYSKAAVLLAKFQPIYDFLELSTAAQKHNASIITTPIRNIDTTRNLNISANTGELQTLILKMTDHEFGTISVKTTSLKDTLKLANTDAFKDYRFKSNEWIQDLVHGKTDGLEAIRKDLRNAQLHIKTLKMLEIGGVLLTYLGVYLAFKNIQLEYIPNVSLAVLGAVPLVYKNFVDQQYRWASYNHIHK